MRSFLLKFFPSKWVSLAWRTMVRAESAFFSIPVVGASGWKKRKTGLETAPFQLNIEVTSICNAKCVMCPRHMMDRKMEVMPAALYEKIIRDARNVGVKRFVLNGYGEIFTAKRDYQRFISLIKSEVPGARIIINTNASLMNESVAQYLIDSEVDSLNINIDGATRETFEKIRENLHFDDVVRNVRRLLDMRKAQGRSLPKVRVGMIHQPGNYHEAGVFRKQWEGVADYVGDDFLVSRGGSVQVDRAADVSRPCYLLWSELSILSNGEAVICCDDWNCQEVMGNLWNQGIQEVWMGEKFRTYRELHLKGSADQIEICKSCNWARPGPDWFQDHIRR